MRYRPKCSTRSSKPCGPIARAIAISDRAARWYGRRGESVSICEDGKRLVSRVRVRDVSRSGIGFCASTKFFKDQRVIIQLQSRRRPIWLMCVAAHCRRIETDRYSNRRAHQAGDAFGASFGGSRRNWAGRRLQLLLDPAARASAARISKAILA